jgi:hypothetical protein
MDPIEFNLNPSWTLTILVVLIYLGAGVSLSLINLSMPIKILVMVFAYPVLFYRCKRDLQKHLWQKNPNSIVRLWQNCEGKWGCETRSGRLIYTELLGDSFISSLLIVLRLKSKTKVMNAAVGRDSLSPEDYRTLIKRILFFEPIS